MVINNDPDYEKKKAFQEKLAEGEFVRRRRLLDQFMDCSSSIIALAFMYAKNFEATGYDITEKWVTAERQADILQQVYNKGYKEGMIQGQIEGKKRYEKQINKSNDTVNNADSSARPGTVSGPRRDMVQPANAPRRRNCTKKRHKR